MCYSQGEFADQDVIKEHDDACIHIGLSPVNFKKI